MPQSAPMKHLLGCLVVIAAQLSVAAPHTLNIDASGVSGETERYEIHREGDRLRVGLAFFGPDGELTLRLATAPAAPVTIGLSSGDPETAGNRAVHLRFGPGGALAHSDGTTWRDLPGIEPTSPVLVKLDRQHGSFSVRYRSPAGELAMVEGLPFENQTIFCDTVFASGLAPGAALTLTINDFPPSPPRPTLQAERLTGGAVRLFWSPPRDAVVSGYRLYRDGALVAELEAEAKVRVDDSVAPRTLYTYRLEAVGAGWSAPVALVTGPGNERLVQNSDYEALVYAATPAGIAAAVSLARQGRRVALIEPSDFVGGMISGGLGRTDFGSIHALGGMFKDFMDAVLAHYTQVNGPDSAQAKACREGLYFEPAVARQIFLGWIEAEPTLTLTCGAHLAGVKTVDGRATAVVLQDRHRNVRQTLTAKVFVDASYEGDLAAYAGASYLIGREPREAYDETLAGKLWWDVWKREIVQVEGTGDRVVQAYCYRLCLTRNVDDRLPPPPPRHYERARYLGLLRDVEREKLKSLKDILSILPLPNEKTDANNHPQGDPSSDLIGGADDFPEADWAQREELAAAHVDHILGLLWFLRTDPAVPEFMRLDAQRWGLSRSEFPELSGWSSQLYVREGRRILGDHVFTEHDAMATGEGLRSPIHRDSIAVGAYPIDSHATGGRHPDNPDLLEGFFYLHGGQTKPYHIPYGVMLPEGLHNVLVAGCVSSTHIGYGTLRMEPVFMGLGTAAGLAADLALTGDGDTRLVPLEQLQLELLHRGQVITVFEDVGPNTVGRDGFNLFGTFGTFPTYQARPDEPLTSADLAHWLASVPYLAWSADAAGLTPAETPLSGEALSAILATLAQSHGVHPAPRLTAETVTRGQAMEALWSLVARWLRARG